MYPENLDEILGQSGVPHNIALRPPERGGWKYHSKLGFQETCFCDSIVRHECEKVDSFFTCTRMKVRR